MFNLWLLRLASVTTDVNWKKTKDDSVTNYYWNRQVKFLNPRNVDYIALNNKFRYMMMKTDDWERYWWTLIFFIIIQQSFTKMVKKMLGAKPNIYSNCGMAHRVLYIVLIMIFRNFLETPEICFFRHDLERILPYVETISLTLEEESQGLRHLSGSLL